MQQQEKQAYCALIVDMLQHSSHGEHALPTPFAFSNSRKYFEERIDVVMQKRTGRASKMTLAVAGTLTLLVTILGVAVSYAAQANLVVLKSPPSGGYVYGTADAAQLETLNRLRHTETTFGALIAAVFPKAHARIPADALQFIHTATVDWPSEDAPPRPRTFTISGPE
ncbi:MAG: hypothetical protein DDT38_01447 [Firmicutes bacterium]|nr:hypothetical protein [candidate division NPL-UPA2 bacterium]